MNSKQKIGSYLCLIFLAGGVAGGSIAWTASTKQKQKPAHSKHFPDTKRMCDFMRQRLEERVGLTPEQVQKIEPLIEQSARDIRAIHDKTLQDVEDVIRRTHSEIAATLTPEQQARLVEFENERREFWRKHFKKKEHKDQEKLREENGFDAPRHERDETK